MAGSLQLGQLAVPSGVANVADLCILAVEPKVGKVSLLVQSLMERANIPAGAKAASILNFKVWASDDRGVADAWVALPPGSSYLAVAPGGQQTVALTPTKKYLKLTGYGTTSSGALRLDAMYSGAQYQGNITIELIGKSGFGKDGTTPTDDNGIADYSEAAWPE